MIQKFKVLLIALLTSFMLIIPITSSAFAQENTIIVSAEEDKDKDEDGSKYKGFYAPMIEALYSGKFSLGQQGNSDPTSSATTTVEIEFGDIIGTLSKLLDLNFLRNWQLDGHNLWNDIFKNGIYAAASTLATAMAVLFWLTAFLKEAMQFERIDWKRMFMSFVRLCLAVGVIGFSFTFGEKILIMGSQFMNGALSDTAGSIKSIAKLMATIQDSACAGMLDIGGYIKELVVFMCLAVGALAYYGTAIGIVGEIIEKVFKLLFQLALLPFSIARMVEDDGRGNVFQPFMGLFGVFLDIVIAKACLIMASWMLAGLSASSTHTEWTGDVGAYLGGAIGDLGSALGMAIGLVLGLMVVNTLLKGMFRISSEMADKMFR